MADATIFCNHCGAQNVAAAQFCGRCGAVQGPSSSAVVSQGFISRSTLPPLNLPAGVPPTPAAPQVRYGGFWIRLVAAFIDGILIQMVVLPLSLILRVVIGLAALAVRMPGRGTHIVASIVIYTFGFLVAWIYEASMESSSRQATLGKMALNLAVVDLQGNRISFARASGRHFAKFLSGMILLIGYIMAGFTERKQALHDVIAGTLVRRN
jgi:uncharacterized RDD family membrane protein YckC